MSDSIGVIGASVAGLHAAWLLARGGRDVRVYESSPRFDPVPRCLIVTGAIRDLLGDRVEPAVRNEVDRFELHAGGQVLEVPIDRPDLIIERAVLVRELARAASDAGAQIVFGHRLERIVATDRGLDLRFRNNGEVNVCVGSVIGADGAVSTVAREAGWPRQPLVPLVQAIVRWPRELSPQTVRVWFVPADTPYFYWLIPESESLGALGIIGTERINSRAALDRFAGRQELEVLGYQGARIPEYRRWIPPRRRFGPGYVYLIGDAAGQAKVTTVGGVVNGLWGAQGVADAILGGSRRALPGLRVELGLHRLIRTVLSCFDETDYRVLLEELDATARGSLARYSRDDTVRLLWHLLRRRPRLLVHGIRALVGGRAASARRVGPERSGGLRARPIHGRLQRSAEVAAGGEAVGNAGDL